MKVHLSPSTGAKFTNHRNASMMLAKFAIHQSTVWKDGSRMLQAALVSPVVSEEAQCTLPSWWVSVDLLHPPLFDEVPTL